MSSDEPVAADTVVVVSDDKGYIVATAHRETHSAPTPRRFSKSGRDLANGSTRLRCHLSLRG
jgi:hypothetical protein